MTGGFAIVRDVVILLGLASFFALTTVSLAHAQQFDPDDESCVACHEEYDMALSRTKHRLSSTIAEPRVQIGCISCHTGADRHLDDPGLGTIDNPANLEPGRAEHICADCHQPHTETGAVGFDPHLGLDLACTSCHSIHGNADRLLIDEAGDFCGTCHVAVVNEFRKRSNHPLVGQNITCLNCHGFTFNNEPDFGHGGNANCYICHPERSGPYLFEHEAGNSFTPEGDGCLACHNPHGSSNERLLTQPDDRLCRQCHGMPPGHQTAHNGEFSGYGCLDCHSEVHGSYDNLFLLDPLLAGKLSGGPDGCSCHYYR